MDDNTKLATERVNKARAELIMSHTFYGVLISNVDPVPSRQFPTMATDGRRHYFNPDFIATLTQKQLLGVQRHESEHDARRHTTRRNGRDPKEWNVACDYAINIDLVDEGVELPKGALVDAKYRGWSAEDIFRARELDRQREQAKREQEQQQADEDGEDEDTDDAEQGETEGDESEDTEQGDDGEPDDNGDEPGEDDGADDQGDQGDQGQGGQGGQESAELGDGGNADEQGEDGQADDQASGEGAGEPGEGEPSDDTGNGGDGAGEPSQGDAEAGNGQGTSGDPGGCGEVLDAASDAADLSEADSKWERILRQAASLAAKRGTAPGHVSREIERADRPPQDWREVLRAWIDGGAKSIETWSRPNRRFAGGGLYLPGRQRDGINRVVMLVDTSGSMDDIALNCISVEMQAALDEGAIDELIVVYGDTRVTRVDTYHNGDEIEFDPRGGGGTELKPLFDYVRDEVEDPSLIVAFTDGYIDNVAAGGEPPADVLWAYTGYPDVVRQMIANAPWGAPAIDVGSH